MAISEDFLDIENLLSGHEWAASGIEEGDISFSAFTQKGHQSEARRFVAVQKAPGLLHVYFVQGTQAQRFELRLLSECASCEPCTEPHLSTLGPHAP